jgi:hypothetical protein
MMMIVRACYLIVKLIRIILILKVFVLWHKDLGKVSLDLILHLICQHFSHSKYIYKGINNLKSI